MTCVCEYDVPGFGLGFGLGGVLGGGLGLGLFSTSSSSPSKVFCVFAFALGLLFSIASSMSNIFLSLGLDCF